MALGERSRSALYQGLASVVDDEQAVDEMLSHFPARDVEEPVTKDFLRAEMAGMGSELRSEMAGLRNDLSQRIDGSTRWTIGSMVALCAVLVAAIRL